MTRVQLIESLTRYCESLTEDMQLPVNDKKSSEKVYDSPNVFKMRIPDSNSSRKKAPYILHQLITGKDSRPIGSKEESSAVIRTIFCVYCNDGEDEGAMILLNLIERVRQKLLEEVIVENQFELDLEEGLEFMMYTEDTAPYFAGEMVSVWKLPTIKRKVLNV